MNHTNRIPMALWGAAGFLALVAMLLIVPSVGQLIGNPHAKPPGTWVLGLPLLLGAIVFAGAAVGLRGANSSARPKAIPDRDMAQLMEDVAARRVDMKTAQRAIMERASRAAAEGTAEAASSNPSEDEQVTVEKWEHGQGVYRSKVKRTGHLPPGESWEALAGPPGAPPREESPQPNVLAQNDLTLTLARANHLDLDGLTLNRAGHLSPKQIGGILESVAVEIVFYAGIVALLLVLTLTFSAGGAINPAGLIAPCGLAVVLFAAVSLAYLAKQRMGADKYDNGLQVFASVIPDLLEGRVKCVEGITTREMEVRQERLRRRDRVHGDSAAQTERDYWYCVGGEQIAVGQKGYWAFPEEGVKCRAYYLPRSKTLVNLQVME